MLVDVRMISLSVGGTGSRGAFAACCVESTRAAARRRCLKRLNPVFSGMILIYRHPDENTFPRRSRPAASSLAESFITLSALNSFLFNKWIKVFHSTARYTPFEEMRPALTKWFLAQERKKKKPHYCLQLKLRDHSHLWNALRSSSHLFFMLFIAKNVATFFVPPVNSFQIILIYTVSASVQIIVIKSVCVVWSRGAQKLVFISGLQDLYVDL